MDTKRQVRRCVLQETDPTYECPDGEGPNGPTSATDCEGIHKDHDLGATVQRGTEEEVVLAEPRGAVPGNWVSDSVNSRAMRTRLTDGCSTERTQRDRRQ